MSFEFSPPKFQAETASERRMYAYLYQMVQQLNWAMNQIRSGDGTVYFEKAAGAAEGRTVWDPSSESFQELKSLIIKSADTINAIYPAIRKKLQGEYVAESAFGTFMEKVELDLEANAKGISQNYTHIQQISGNLDTMQTGVEAFRESIGNMQSDVSQLQSQITSTNAYIRTGHIGEDKEGLPVYGLEIGQTNEVGGHEVFNKYARFSSSRLSFYDRNDTEVAYISDFKLYITNVHITGNLIMGGYEVDTSDGLAFRWIGGEN